MKPQLIGLSAQLQNGKDTVAELIQKLTTENRYHNNYSAREGKFVQDKFPYYSESPWHTRRFAGKLKEMTAILLGCDVKDFENIEFKNKPLGEEWRIFPLQYKNAFGSQRQLFNSEKDREDFIEHGNILSIEDVEDSYLLTPRLVLQLLGTEGGRDVIHPNIWVNATLGDLKDTDYVIVTDTRFPNEVEGIKRKGGIVVKIIRPSIVSTSTHPSEISLNDYTDWDYIIINDGTIQELEEKVLKMLYHFNIKTNERELERSSIN